MSGNASLIGGQTGQLDQTTTTVLTNVLTGSQVTAVTTLAGGGTVITGRDSVSGAVDNVFIAPTNTQSQGGVNTPQPISVNNLGSVSGAATLVVTAPPAVIAAPIATTFTPTSLRDTSTQLADFIVADLRPPETGGVGGVAAGLGGTTVAGGGSSEVSRVAFQAAVQNAMEIIIPKAAGASLQVVTPGTSAAQTAQSSSEIAIIGNANREQLLAVNLAPVADDKIVALENIENALLIGNGAVRISGNQPAVVAGDNADQVIIGGGGSDTLVGGGGSDTLNGGAGNDVYGITGGAGSNLRIEGFSVGQDSLAFKLPGVTNFEQLVARVSVVNFVNGNIVATFADGSTVTLVGVTPDQLTASLAAFKFTI